MYLYGKKEYSKVIVIEVTLIYRNTIDLKAHRHPLYIKNTLTYHVHVIILYNNDVHVLKYELHSQEIIRDKYYPAAKIVLHYC